MKVRNSKGELKTPTLEPKQPQTAYRGYLISRSPFNSHYSIRKNGTHIGYARDYADAVRIIEELNPEKL